MAPTERYSTSIDNVEDDSMRGRVRDDEWVLRTKWRSLAAAVKAKDMCRKMAEGGGSKWQADVA